MSTLYYSDFQSIGKYYNNDQFNHLKNKNPMILKPPTNPSTIISQNYYPNRKNNPLNN